MSWRDHLPPAVRESVAEALLKIQHPRTHRGLVGTSDGRAVAHQQKAAEVAAVLDALDDNGYLLVHRDNDPNLVGSLDIAARANVNQAVVSAWKTRYDDFPNPVRHLGANLNTRPLYWWPDVAGFLARNELPKSPPRPAAVTRQQRAEIIELGSSLPQAELAERCAVPQQLVATIIARARELGELGSPTRLADQDFPQRQPPPNAKPVEASKPATAYGTTAPRRPSATDTEPGRGIQ